MPVLNFADGLRLGDQVVDAVHLDAHRVYPPPPPRLVPPMGQVSTPDTPADYIGGSIRLRAKLRLDSVPTGTAVIAWQRATGASNIAYDWYTGPTGTLRFRVSTSGTALEMSASPLPDGSLVVGVDQWIGTRWELVGAQNITYGEVSTDGMTWHDVTNVPRAGNLTVFDSTASTIIGALAGGGVRLPGRIYWAEMAAILRAWLTLPGVVGNLLTVPDQPSWPGDIEIVARCAFTNITGPYYEAIVANRAGGIEFLFRRLTGANRVQLVWTDNASGTVYQPASGNIPVGNGVLAWYRARLTVATGVVTFDYAPDQPSEPTVWTSAGTGTSVAPTSRRSTTADWTIGAQVTAGSDPLNGRIARVIVRNGIAGTTVLDVNQHNAGKMATPTTFVASTGQTVTVLQTARLVFPGVVGNYLSVPDSTPLHITGSFEVVVRAAFDWMSSTASNVIGGRYATSGLGGRSWYLQMDMQYPGRPRLALSQDGSAGTSATSTTAVPFGNGPGWLKSTYDAPTGTVRFYTAPDAATEPTTWTQLGGDRTGMPTSMWAGTARVVIGRHDVGENGPFLGRIHRMIVRNAIGGTVVLDVGEQNTSTPGQLSFAASTGGTVTVNQTAGNTIVQASDTPIVRPQADSIVWRFDANEWPPGVTLIGDPRGRSWTATNGDTVQHPASEPD